MPIYEYRCNGCGHEFEQFQSIKDNPVKMCPICNENKVERLISAGTGLIFKGSGFYITDYKNSHVTSGSPVDSNGHSNNGKHESKKAPEKKSGESGDTSKDK